MENNDLLVLLDQVRDGATTPESALERLRRLPFGDLGFARVDHHRTLRQGIPEAVLAQGKTSAQCASIVAELIEHGSGPVVLTRANPDQVAATLARCPGGTLTPTPPEPEAPAVVTWRHAPPRDGLVTLVTAGTSDLPVANECLATLTAYGLSATVIADSGVAGIHRLLVHEAELQKSDVVVVIAGMEGALASVVGGIVAAPVVAVPTSVGYGASLGGVTALLAMLASCAAGVAVVGIDNGFGAACAVARILR